MTTREDDPLIEAIAAANPVPSVPAVPPLGRLPRRRRAVPAAVVLVMLVFAGVALLPSSTPGGGEVLRRALAGEPHTGGILHWRLRVTHPGMSLTFTEDLWLRVNRAGVIDKVHELRLDGEHAGFERAIDQPGGLADPRGSTGRERESPAGPIRTYTGFGYADLGFTDVISTALEAAAGKLDVGAARAVRFRGHDAYAIVLRKALPPAPGSTRRNPSRVSVTMWIERRTNRPLAVRWGEGKELWQLAEVQAFDRLADNARNARLLELG